MHKEGSKWILLQHKNCVYKRHATDPRGRSTIPNCPPLLCSALLCSPRLFLFKMNYPINFVKSSPRPAAASQFCGFPIPTRDQRIYFSFVDTLIQYNWPLRRIYHSTQTRKCPLFLFSRDRNLNQKSSILISLNLKSVGWGKGWWSKWNGMKPFKYFSFRMIKLTHPALNILRK